MNTSPGLHRFGLVLACCLTVAAVTATAAPVEARARPRVAILEIQIEGDAAPELRDQLDKSLAGGLYAAGWDVLSRTAVAKKLEGTPELVGCMTTTCLEKLGEMMGTSRFVRVRVAATGAAYTVELELLASDVATGPIARLEKSCAPCTFDEANEMMSAAARQLREGAGDKILVRVSSDPAGAVIELDGKALGVAPLDIEVLPGEHVFRAKLAGRTDALVTSAVEAQPGGEAQIVALTLESPGGGGELGGGGEHALGGGGGSADAGDPGQHPFRLWKWAAAGGGAATLFSGLWLLSIDGDGIGCPPGPGQCPEHYETTAAGTLLSVTGVALGGVAVWMFIKDRPHSDGPGIAARPIAGGALVYYRSSF